MPCFPRLSWFGLVCIALGLRVADSAPAVPTNAPPAGVEAEAPQPPPPSPELLAALEEARVAAESLLKREAYLSASNATVRTLVEKRAKLTRDREEVIAQLPDVKDLEKTMARNKASWAELLEDKGEPTAEQEEKRKALRLEMAKQRREYRRLTLDVATNDPKVAALSVKLQEVGKEIQAALALDPAYAGFLRDRNKAMLRHQRLSNVSPSTASTTDPAPAVPPATP